MHRTSTFDALGYAFALQSKDPDVAAYFDDIYRGLRAEKGSPHVYELRVDGVWFDGEGMCGCATPVAQLNQVLWHVTQRVTDDNEGKLLLLHASAMAKGDRAVLLAAPSESGKSTLAAGLLRAGFDYVTDELVAIDPDTGLIQPYPKPISIDKGSWEVLADLRPQVPDHLSDYVRDQWQVAPDRVAGPCRPTLVVFPRYDADGPTTLEPRSRASALVALVENSFNFKRDGRRWLAVGADLVRGAECRTLAVSDLDAAVSLIEQAL